MSRIFTNKIHLCHFGDEDKAEEDASTRTSRKLLPRQGADAIQETHAVARAAGIRI